MKQTMARIDASNQRYKSIMLHLQQWKICFANILRSNLLNACSMYTVSIH
jgi:hypothetical protein